MRAGIDIGNARAAAGDNSSLARWKRVRSALSAADAWRDPGGCGAEIRPSSGTTASGGIDVRGRS